MVLKLKKIESFITKLEKFLLWDGLREHWWKEINIGATIGAEILYV